MRKFTKCLRLYSKGLTQGERDNALAAVIRLLEHHAPAISRASDQAPAIRIIEGSNEVAQAVREKHVLVRQVDDLKRQLCERDLVIFKYKEKNKALTEQTKKLNKICPAVTSTTSIESMVPTAALKASAVGLTLPALHVLPLLDNAVDDMRKDSAATLAALLLEMSDPAAEDRQIRAGHGMAAIGAWYRRRRAHKPLPDFMPNQRHAIELMDALYLSFEQHDKGRKHVQDVFTYQWWKVLYPLGTVSLRVSERRYDRVAFRDGPTQKNSAQTE